TSQAPSRASAARTALGRARRRISITSSIVGGSTNPPCVVIAKNANRQEKPRATVRGAAVRVTETDLRVQHDRVTGARRSGRSAEDRGVPRGPGVGAIPTRIASIGHPNARGVQAYAIAAVLPSIGL